MSSGVVGAVYRHKRRHSKLAFVVLPDLPKADGVDRVCRGLVKLAALPCLYLYPSKDSPEPFTFPSSGEGGLFHKPRPSREVLICRNRC